MEKTGAKKSPYNLPLKYLVKLISTVLYRLGVLPN
jgi:hypothetical protein